MQKRILLIIIGLLIVAVVMSRYFRAPSVGLAYRSRSAPELLTSGKSQWVQYWNELDIAAVRSEYQPYSVMEMREMWDDKLLTKHDGSEGFKHVMEQADAVYPVDTYLARMLKLGRPFVDFSDYEDALLYHRLWLYSTRLYWYSLSTAEKSASLQRHGLPTDTTWAVYEEVLLKTDVVYGINFWRSKALDPSIDQRSLGHSTHNLKVRETCASQTTIPKRLTYVVSTGAAKPAQS